MLNNLLTKPIYFKLIIYILKYIVNVNKKKINEITILNYIYEIQMNEIAVKFLQTLKLFPLKKKEKKNCKIKI